MARGASGASGRLDGPRRRRQRRGGQIIMRTKMEHIQPQSTLVLQQSMAWTEASAQLQFTMPWARTGTVPCETFAAKATRSNRRCWGLGTYYSQCRVNEWTLNEGSRLVAGAPCCREQEQLRSSRSGKRSTQERSLASLCHSQMQGCCMGSAAQGGAAPCRLCSAGAAAARRAPAGRQAPQEHAPTKPRRRHYSSAAPSLCGRITPARPSRCQWCALHKVGRQAGR